MGMYADRPLRTLRPGTRDRYRAGSRLPRGEGDKAPTGAAEVEGVVIYDSEWLQVVCKAGGCAERQSRGAVCRS